MVLQANRDEVEYLQEQSNMDSAYVELLPTGFASMNKRDVSVCGTSPQPAALKLLRSVGTAYMVKMLGLPRCVALGPTKMEDISSSNNCHICQMVSKNCNLKFAPVWNHKRGAKLALIPVIKFFNQVH